MAQRDYIKVNAANAAASKAMNLISFKDALTQVFMQGPVILAIMNQNFDDSNPQSIIWSDLETLFGIPTGTGQTVFDMLNGTMGALNGTMQNNQAANLIARVG